MLDHGGGVRRIIAVAGYFFGGIRPGSFDEDQGYCIIAASLRMGSQPRVEQLTKKIGRW